MRNDSTHTVDRRTYLKLTGAAGGAMAFAGCLDGEEIEDLTEITVTLSQFPDTIDPLDHIPATTSMSSITSTNHCSTSSPAREFSRVSSKKPRSSKARVSPNSPSATTLSSTTATS